MGRTARIAMLLCCWLPLCNTNADAADAGAILESLPNRVEVSIIIVNGALGYTEGVSNWRLLLNDAVAYNWKVDNMGQTNIRVALNLRQGDNLIRLESLTATGSAISKAWSKHIYRAPERSAERFALLVQGTSTAAFNSTQAVSAMRAKLAGLGVKSQNILLASGFDETNQAIDTIAHSSKVSDRVFIYYAGEAKKVGSSGEPGFIFSEPTSRRALAFPLTDLIRAASEFPSSSVVVDAAFRVESDVQEQNPAAADEMAVPWLQALHWPPNVELALSHKTFTAASTGAGRLTDSITSTPLQPDANECESLSSLTQQLSNKSDSAAAATPLYYRGDASFSSFCFDRGPSDSPVTIEVKQAQLDDPYLLAIDVVSRLARTIQASWIEVLVDGVVLRHRSITPTITQTTDRIAISEGTHLIAVRAGGGPAVLAQGYTECFVPGLNKVSVHLPSKTLHSRFQDPSTTGATTTNVSASVVFVIGNSNEEGFHYQFRNNGVIIGRGTAPVSRYRLELVRRIPLNLGSNNITIEASDNQGDFAEAKVLVIRRPSQPVRAVVVGTTSPYASEDADLMKRTILRFTDAGVDDIIVLSGKDATRARIEQAISNNSVLRPADPVAAGIYGQETFLLYVASYGLTLDGKTRCLLPSDFEPQRPRETCLSTEEFDALLGTHERSLVIVDSSYDGRSGNGHGGSGPGVERSRTYKDFVADNSSWRTSAGVDRADRLFLVAGETNSPALTSDAFGHGLFTISLSEAIVEQAGVVKDDSPKQASIYEAFAGARNKTLDKSEGQQRPIIKGVLSAPFTFSEKSLRQLKEEADGIVQRTTHDGRALRTLNMAQLDRAKSLYQKVLFFSPSDSAVRVGLATIDLYQGNLQGAESSIEQGLQDSGNDQDARANWLLLRSRLKARKGDISGAGVDANEAYHEQPRSTDIRIELAYLRAASGDYDSCRQLLEELGHDLLDKNKTAESNDVKPRVADDNWGRAVLLLYIAFQRTGHSHSASLLLQSYGEVYHDKFSLKWLVDNPVSRALLARHSRAVAIGSQNVEEPWSHLVAEYFQQPAKYENDLTSFRNRTQTLDLKDETAFNCLLHYYKGMRALVDGNREQARTEFEAVNETSRTDYIEYWVVQSELKSLNTSAASWAQHPSQ